MIGVEQTKELAPVQFVPIPEIKPEGIEEFLANVEHLQRIRTRSFGACVIRKVPEERLEHCLKWLDARNPGYDPQYFHKSSRLHTDSGRTGDITFHHTKIGMARFIILIGAALPGTPNPHVFSNEAAQRLVHLGQLDAQELQLPTQALEAQVGPGDLIAFDHSQPHIAQNLSESRNSTAYY